MLPEYEKVEQIVTYSDQNPESNVSHTQVPVTIPRKLRDVSEIRYHSISDFLERPRNVFNFTWSTASPAGTTLMAAYCPDVLFTTEMCLCKARDFRYFKADINFTFKLNMNVMSVGRLIVVTYPQPLKIGNQVNKTSLTNLTGFQHAFIEAGSSNSVNFKVTFVYSRGAYDFLYDVQDPWAGVAAVVFNPLKSSSGSASGTVAVWCNVVKGTVEFDVPTTQANSVYPPPFTPSTPPLFAQSTEAKVQAEKGTISGGIAKAASVAKTIGGMGLGPVSEVAGAASWVGDIVSNALSAFGYSKPANQQTIAPMVQQPARNYTHFNGDDSSVVIGADARNSIDIDTKLFAIEIDEMDINYVISVPMFLYSFKWNMSDTPGKVLFQAPVTPGFCPNSPNTTSVGTTYLNYVASMFEYWRGSLKYKLGFVANRFYQGTVGVAFLSGVFTITNPIPLDEIEAAPKVVCQVTDSTDCTFVVPYNISTPFLKVQLASLTSVGTKFTHAELLDPTISAGTLVIYVINGLTGPATVPDEIDVNLFIAGTDNTKFAIPSLPVYVPVPIVEEEVLSPLNEKDEEQPFAHMNAVPDGLNNAKGEKDCMEHVFLAKSEPSKKTTFHEMSMGDAQFSLRQLTRMFSVIQEGTIPASNALTLDPSDFGWTLTDFTNNRLFRIARMYGYWRGSVRFKFIPVVPDSSYLPTFKVWSYSKDLSPPDTPSYVPAPFPAEGNVGFSWVTNAGQTPFIEFSMPFYRNVYIELLSDTVATKRNKVQILPGVTGSCDYSVLSAAGDDFTFGFLLPPPDLQLLTTS